MIINRSFPTTCKITSLPPKLSLLIFLSVTVGFMFLVTGNPTVGAAEEGNQEQNVRNRRQGREEKEAEMKWSNAESAYLTQNFETARKLYLNIVRQFSDTDYAIKALSRIGDVYRSQQDYQQAIEFYRRMTARYKKLDADRKKDLRDSYIRTRYQIGAVYYDQKKYRQVFGTLRRFIQDFPNSKYANVAYFLIGESHLAKENYRGAIEAFDSVGTAKGAISGDEMPAVSPGEMLYVQMEDPDMRASGINEIMKVRVTSSAGDMEEIYLQPRGLRSARYVGHIKTQLGEPLSTAPLEEAWSIAVDREVTQAFRRAEELEQQVVELRQRRQDLERKMDEVAADDSISGQEQVKTIDKIENDIANIDENIVASQRLAHKKRKTAYETIDKAYSNIEKFLKKNLPDRTVKAQQDSSDKATSSESDKSQSSDQMSEAQKKTLDTRASALQSSTSKSNFEKRRSVLRKWTKKLYHDIKRLEVSGDDTITVLYRDQHVSSGKGPEMRKSKIGVASDAYISFMSDDYTTEVRQEVYASPTNIQVTDPDQDISDKKDTVEVVLSIVDQATEESEEGEDNEENNGQQVYGGHTDYRESYAPSEQRAVKKEKTEDGEVIRQVVEAESDEKPALIPDDAPNITIELTETEPHSGVFTKQLSGTPRGIKVNDKTFTISPTQRLRAAYADQKNISRRRPWVVWAAVSFVPSSEGTVEAPQTQDAPLTRQAQLEKGISEGELAKVYEKLGLDQMAESYYQRALRTCARVARAEGLTALGQEATHAIWRLYFESGHPEKAIAACKQLVKEFPNSDLVDKAYLTMGEALMKKAENAQGREKTNLAREALRALKGLLKTDTNDENKANALYNMGKALYMSGEDGSNYMEKVVQQYPDSSYAAMALKKSGRRAYENADYESANEYFTRIVMNYPDAENIAEVMYLRGHSQVKQGNYRKAMQAYSELINSHPGSAYAQKAQKVTDFLRKKINQSG